MDSTTDNSVFEGMFVRALQPSGKFLEDLRAVGYDPANPEIRYHAQVWREALEVARRHCYPTLPAEEGFRNLGRRFIEGFFQTIAGRFMSVAMPLIGPVAVIKRLPKYFAVARTGINIEVSQVSEKQWRVVWTDRYPSPDFVAGVIEGAGKYTRHAYRVVVSERRPDGFNLLVDL